MNNFPAMTEAQREAALTVAIRLADEKNIVSLNDAVYVRLLAEIALAALAAEPVHQFIVNNPDNDGYAEWADCNPDYFSKEPCDMRRLLYTAPSAPVLRVPDGWIKCSEQMPELGATVLVYMDEPIHSATNYAVATYDKYGFSRSKVTH